MLHRTACTHHNDCPRRVSPLRRSLERQTSAGRYHGYITPAVWTDRFRQRSIATHSAFLIPVLSFLNVAYPFNIIGPSSRLLRELK